MKPSFQDIKRRFYRLEIEIALGLPLEKKNRDYISLRFERVAHNCMEIWPPPPGLSRSHRGYRHP